MTEVKTFSPTTCPKCAAETVHYALHNGKPRLVDSATNKWHNCKRLTAAEEQKQLIIDLAKRARIDGWNEFVEELKVPGELIPALQTNRPELVRLAIPRALSADEARALYKLIGGLLETNNVLREHAQAVSGMLENWIDSIHGMVGVAGRISRFAEFRHNDAATEGEDED